MDYRQEVPSYPLNVTSSSPCAILAGTKRSAEQDAEDLREGDKESPRSGTKRNRDPDDHENRDGTLIEKFLVGCRGIVENHCDDDDGSRKIKKRWADMEDTDTDDMPPDVVYDDIGSHQLGGTLVREARMNEVEGLGSLGVWDIVDMGDCYQKTGKPPIRGRWIDINNGDVKKPSVSITVCCPRATASAQEQYPRRTLRGKANLGGHQGAKIGRGDKTCPWGETHESFYLLTSPTRSCTRQ